MPRYFSEVVLAQRRGYDSERGGGQLLAESVVMSKNEKRTVRKPATKYPNLQKKMQKRKAQALRAKKK
jgi:hypothetical protein